MIDKGSYGIIDNFLPEESFNQIKNAILPEYSSNMTKIRRFGWSYEPSVATLKKETEDWRLIAFVGMIYEKTIVSQEMYNIIVPHFLELGVRQFIRIKINLFPNTETIREHGVHHDYPFDHKGALFYLNTNNGYTKLEDGTKIKSVENRLLLFDSSKPHRGSTCSDSPARININFNYF